MASDNAVFVNSSDVGYPAIDTSIDAEVVECNVLIDHDVIIQPSSSDARVVETGSTITALFSDVGEPSAGSTFEVDGEVFKVARITDNNRILVTMAVVAS